MERKKKASLLSPAGTPGLYGQFGKEKNKLSSDAGWRGARSRIAGVVGRDDAAVFGSAAEPVKHLVRGFGDADDGFPAIVFTAEIGGHHADHVRALA